VTYGMAAVWLFFVLSAFLLTQPFLKSNLSFSARSVAIFYVRRIFRIIPMYVFFVVVFGITLRGMPYIVDNLLLLRGEDHLWTVNQEMAFYLIMPVFIAGLFLLRRRPLPCVVILLALGVASDKYLAGLEPGSLIQYFHGPFYVSLFFLGMAAAFAIPSALHFTQRLKSGIATSLISLAIFMVALVPHIYAASLFTRDTIALENDQPLLMGATFVPLLVWVSVCPINWLTKFLSLRPLRIIGRAGFSFYLIHVATLTAFNGRVAIGIDAFICAAFLTGICSMVTFSLIERPGIRIGNAIIDYFEAGSSTENALTTIIGP
jgi:peptidoglycan/LPS O-acetylase OafA/YrhL